MKFFMLAMLLLFTGCAYKPCTNKTQNIWEPTVLAQCMHSEGNRMLVISFEEEKVAVISVTITYRGGSTDVVWDLYKSHICRFASLNHLCLENVFPEDRHGEMIGVKILVAYKGRVFEVPVYVMVQRI